MKTKSSEKGGHKIRLIAISVVTILIVLTGILFWVNAYFKGDVIGGIVGAVIAATILVFAVFIFMKGYKDMKEGYPVEDERSKRVKERAASRAFYASLYLLLIVGLLSDTVIKFRDVSQAVSATVGGMAILFAAFWLYYNNENRT